MTTPIVYEWTGSAMTPVARFREVCQQYFEQGGRYRLVEMEESPSSRSRGQYFAALRDAWNNLPEDIAGDFRNVEHLRKWALIKCGYCHERNIVCADRDEALRVATEFTGDYDLVLTQGNCVKIFEAASQSARAMGKKEFQASKQAVLDLVSSLIGVQTETLQANAGRAA